MKKKLLFLHNKKIIALNNVPMYNYYKERAKLRLHFVDEFQSYTIYTVNQNLFDSNFIM